MTAEPAPAAVAAAAGAEAVTIRSLVKTFVDRRTGETVRAVDDVSLTIHEGEFFALLGPSGCGKTTTLRVVAGFEDPTSGEVLLRGRPVLGVPPFHRPVNTVFQDYALFPHMSVLQNVMFGLRMAKVARAEARRRALDALDLVRLPGVGDRKPAQLSGGQRQRVALARAIVNRPAVLLLDEPLGALDLKLRKAMQLELKTLQQQLGITFVYVTHDQEEALTMADRIAVMEGGQALQVGTPEEVYERPTSRFVADFIGETNLVPGVLERKDGGVGTVRLADGQRLRAVLRDPELALGHEALLALRPEKLDVRPRATEDGPTDPAAGGSSGGDGWAVVSGTIADAHYLGTDTRYLIALPGGVTLAARIQNQHVGYGGMLPGGSPVEVRWREEHASLLT